MIHFISLCLPFSLSLCVILFSFLSLLIFVSPFTYGLFISLTFPFLSVCHNSLCGGLFFKFLYLLSLYFSLSLSLPSFSNFQVSSFLHASFFLLCFMSLLQPHLAFFSLFFFSPSLRISFSLSIVTLLFESLFLFDEAVFHHFSSHIFVLSSFFPIFLFNLSLQLLSFFCRSKGFRARVGSPLSSSMVYFNPFFLALIPSRMTPHIPEPESDCWRMDGRS